jgi:hypothetical protein
MPAGPSSPSSAPHLYGVVEGDCRDAFTTLVRDSFGVKADTLMRMQARYELAKRAPTKKTWQ